MYIYIRNMVCNRCIMVVKGIFEKAGVKVVYIKLGEVLLEESISPQQRDELEKSLFDAGFEILTDHKHQLIEKIKNIIIAQIQNTTEETRTFSEVLSAALHKDYSYLSKLFSEAEDMTIEKFIIYQKIEKVKELLVYGEKTLNEIAFQLGYSSVAHLSTQFKKTTGFNPSEFRKLKDHHRRSIDQI